MKAGNARQTDLDKFKQSDRDGLRVCLLSGVGMAGLNLAQASILIVLVREFAMYLLLMLLTSL